MKSFGLGAILLASGVFCSPLDKRQHSHGDSPSPKGKAGGLSELAGIASSMSGKNAKAQKSFKIVKLAPTIPRDGAERWQIWYGPFKIRAKNSKDKTETGFSMDPAGTGWSHFAEDFPKDVTVLRGTSTIIYEDGTKAQITNGLYNHHLIFTDLKKTTPPMVSCNAKSTFRNPMSLFIGGSEDVSQSMYTTKDGKFNSGYYVGKDDPILSSGDVVNYTDEQKTVYTMTDFEFVKGKIPDMYEVSTQVLSVGMCDGAQGIVSMPKDGQKKWSVSGKNDITAVADGYIVNASGHLHDGGVNVVLKLNGKALCNSEAKYGGADATLKVDGNAEWKTISAMTSCEGPIEVKKGDKFNLEAHYDMELHPARKQHDGGMAEVMALHGIVFAAKTM